MPWRRSRVEWRPRVLLLLPLLLLPLHPAAAAEPISSSSGIRPRAAFWPSCRPSHPRAASSHSLRLQPLRCSSLDARVVAVERILDTHVFPERQAAADARKTLAFISQDRFLGRGEATTMPADSSAAGLTKPHLTYGEFPLSSLATLLSQLQLGPDDVFLDLGSGSGRLVLGVALLWPQLRACVGMELLPELHALAVQAHQRALTDPAFLSLALPRSPCRFVRGDAEAALWTPPPPLAAAATAIEDNDDHMDPVLAAAGEGGKDPLASATVVFAYATTWRSDDALHLAPPLHAALLRRLAPGVGQPNVTVITTDKRLREGVVGGGEGGRAFRVVRRMDVPNPEVWESTAYFTELVVGGGV